jgi:pentatricopeptide repeat protein
LLYQQAPVTSASVIGKFDSASAKIDSALGKAESHSTSSRIRFHPVVSRDFSSSAIKGRPRRAEEKNVQDILVSSESFLRTQDLPFKKWSSKNFQIFTQWHQALFKIPYTNQQLLEKCAVCIDSLVHAFLEKYTIQTDSAGRAKCRATQFVCTGIYAWGRVAEYDRQAPVKAEMMFQRLKEAYDDSQKAAAFRPTEEVYSALTYCWSMASSHPQAPVRAHRWLNVILEDPRMNVRAPTYNAVLRAYAKQGNIVQVQQLIAEMPIARDAYVYESLVRAWLNSDHPDAPQEALKALQEGIQQGLEHKDIASLANLFLGFMNMNRDKPELCERALKQILILQQEHPSLDILDVRHLVTAMQSWADKGESEKVERLFGLLQYYNEKGDEELQPTYQVNRILFDAVFYRFQYFPD